MSFARLNDVTLSYRWDGPAHGPVVLLSNSLSSNLGMWQAQVPALVEAGYRVLRYDTRGHGASSVANSPTTVATLAGDALGLLDHLGVERVHFCGLSLGGITGQWLGTHHAQRLSSLALCATAAWLGPPEMWNQRIEAVAKGGMAAIADATIDRWFTKANQARLASEVARVRDGILNTPVAGYRACCGAIRDMDQRESIAAIALPTLVMVGADDPSTPVAASELIHQRIAGSKLVVIPASQHFFNVEEPAQFNAALLGFLAGVAAAVH
jgi:3-oxoadipate enol-lactonase